MNRNTTLKRVEYENVQPFQGCKFILITTTGFTDGYSYLSPLDFQIRYNTNCSSKCRIANFEFTIACPELVEGVNTDRSTKLQIERSENMRHLVD
ncbi:MAG: hypothetical protein PF484_13280 [Bacteroidales bacterium]|jgi:hypothetical protein|nr:hypothetical protein [Bacteroidales bacterium]